MSLLLAFCHFAYCKILSCKGLRSVNNSFLFCPEQFENSAVLCKHCKQLHSNAIFGFMQASYLHVSSINTPTPRISAYIVVLGNLSKNFVKAKLIKQGSIERIQFSKAVTSCSPTVRECDEAAGETLVDCCCVSLGSNQ